MRRIFIILSALAVLGLLAAAGAETLDLEHMDLEALYALRDEVSERISALEKAGDQQVYDSGSYMVGRDIPGGDYVLIENENAMFASVIVREDDSEDSSLVAHHLINHQLVVRLRAGTWLTLSEARAYPISLAPAIENATTSEGGYLVGVSIPEGSYTVHISDKAPLSSYSIYDDILGTDAQLVKFEVVHDTMEIELKDGDYIELSGCWLGPEEEKEEVKEEER